MKSKQKHEVRDSLMSRTKKSLKYQSILVLFLLTLFVFVEEIRAEEAQHIKKGDIIINELMWMGMGEDSDDEWIELRNTTKHELNLAGLYVENGGSGSKKVVIPVGNSIGAKGYFIIAKKDKENSAAKALIDKDAESPWLKLSNISLLDGGEALVLKTNDGPKSEIIDVAWKNAKWPAGENPSKDDRAMGKIKKSMERNDVVADGTMETSWHTCTNDPAVSIETKNCATPGKENSKKAGNDKHTASVCKDKIILSEIFPFEGEFVEVKNEGSEKCDLAGWKVSDQKNGKHEFPASSMIKPGKYFAFMKNIGLNSSSADGAKLFDPSDVLVDEIAYEKPPGKEISFSRDDSGKWRWTTKTPNTKNTFEDKVETKKEYPTGISITELFPNPFQSQYEEYVELYNSTAQDVDLFGWSLHDASKTGKYTFAQSMILKAKKYLAIFKKDFKFALNNSGNESVALFDPNGVEVSRAQYDGSKRNASYNFDGMFWRWSKFLTPGMENIFNNISDGTLKIAEKIFVNVYADFLVSTGDLDGDIVKVVWNFGDGHKSYLAKTKHKYLETGTYQGSVRLSDGSEEIIKTFIIEVVEFPHPKVKIVVVNANPSGSDKFGESLTIENKSKKRINLLNWSIATGTKNLTNHPVKKKFILKKKESREIKREISKFVLNNKKGKIELRYPDGKVADKVKYDHGEVSIGEGERYVKVKGKGWQWVREITKEDQNATMINKVEEMIVNDTQGKNERNESKVAGVEVVKKEVEMLRRNDLKNIKISQIEPRVLGAESIREIDGQYFFIPESREQEHYVIVFFKNIFSLTNKSLNMLLNFF